MDIDIVLPQNEIGPDPSGLRDYAVAAQELGFTRLLAFDHVLGVEHGGREPRLTGPYDETDEFHEPLMLFAYLSAVTTTLQFATSVLVLPQREAVLVAKQVAELDLLSGSRFTLGVGVGWNYVEYESLNSRFDDRGKRMNEQIEILRELWTGEVVDFEGTWHRVDRASIAPRPHRSIPIWMGGLSGPAYRRAARLGDGFLFSRIEGHDESGSAEAQARTAGRIRELIVENGRDPGAFHHEGRINFSAMGPSWSRDLELLGSEGFGGVAINPMGSGLRGAGPHIDALEAMAEELGLPRGRAAQPSP